MQMNIRIFNVDRSKELIKRISICIQALKQFFQEINLEIIRGNAIVT